MFQELTQEASFTFSKKGDLYVSNTAYLITGSRLKLLLLFLNTKLIEYYFSNFISVSLGGNGIRWLNQYIQLLPIPQIPSSQQKPFIKLVDKILEKKEKGEDTTEEENKIDFMVYKLYGLTYDEAKIIDPDLPKKITKEEWEKIKI